MIKADCAIYSESIALVNKKFKLNYEQIKNGKYKESIDTAYGILEEMLNILIMFFGEHEKYLDLDKKMDVIFNLLEDSYIGCIKKNLMKNNLNAVKSFKNLNMHNAIIAEDEFHINSIDSHDVYIARHSLLSFCILFDKIFEKKLPFSVIASIKYENESITIISKKFKVGRGHNIINIDIKLKDNYISRDYFTIEYYSNEAKFYIYYSKTENKIPIFIKYENNRKELKESEKLELPKKCGITFLTDNNHYEIMFSYKIDYDYLPTGLI